MQEYVGNRGITITEDFVHTPMSTIDTYIPSSNSNIYIVDNASYKSSKSGNITVLLKGFLVPEKSSRYEIELVSNGDGLLYISKDSSSVNKVNP